jgi:ABC-2 type transport system permease protein
MQMKKSNLAGWKDVFSFTLVQTMKSKAFLISFIILITLSLLSMPLVSKIFYKGNEDVNAPSPIEKVYVYNSTSLQDIDFSKLLTEEKMSHILFETTSEDYDTLSKKVEEETASVILTISEDADMFSLHFLKASKGPVKDTHIQALGSALAKQFQLLRIKTLGITEEQNAMLNARIKTSISAADANGKVVLKEDTSISMTEYWFIYGILFFVLMANMLSSTQIASSIVTEKSTRVVEYLLITVKPLALMIGKIMAMLFATLFQMVSMVVALFISNRITSSILPGNSSGVLEQFLPKDIFQNINIVNIFLCFVLVMLGMIFYATLAGIAGATVSRMEELNEGLTLFTMTNLVGVYIGLGATGTLVGTGLNPFVVFAFLFPLSSPFILPGAILIGKATLPLIGIAIVLELVFILLLFHFVAKVYETLILHNGNKIKLKELIRLSKTV